MPIKKSNRHLYPANWKAISRHIRFVRARGQCEWEGDGKRCEARHGQPHPLTGSNVVLTTAHLDHDPTNSAESNLKAMCQLHHLRYDAKHHATNAAATRAEKGAA